MSETERPEGFEALPKRFKQYIGAIESKMHAMQKERPSQKTNVQLVDYAQREDGLYLPNDCTIRFTVKGSQLDVSSRRTDGEGLEVSAVGDSLMIYPQVSNVVTLLPRKR